jgi:hypothetical protein
MMVGEVGTERSSIGSGTLMCLRVEPVRCTAVGVATTVL